MNDMSGIYIPTYDDVIAAHTRIEPYIHRTPVLTSSYFNQLTGAQLFFKCENFQKAGAFKVRGASNAVFGLDDETAKKGVATHILPAITHCRSATPPGGGGSKATVVMPRTAPAGEEGQRCAAMAASVVECEPSTTPRARPSSRRWWRRSGADFVHPYNDPRVIAGQAHLLEGTDRGHCGSARRGHRADRRRRHDFRDLPDSVKHRTGDQRSTRPSRKNADDACRSFKAGHIIADDAPQTVADGSEGAAQGTHLAFRVEPRGPTSWWRRNRRSSMRCA